MKPIVPPKYDIGLVVKNCSYEMLYELEPWCSTIYTDISANIIDGYIDIEQPNTLFDLKDRVKSISVEPKNDIVVEFNGKELTSEQFNYIAQLSDILKDSGELGKLELEIFKIKINKLETYEGELIVCER